MKRDLHRYERRLENAINNIKKSDISTRNKKTILDFLTDCKIDGAGYGSPLSLGRISRYAGTMLKLAKWLQKDFDKVNKEDLKNLVGNIESKYKELQTKQLYKVSIKKLYKWMNGGEEYPEKVKWIKTTVKYYKKKLPHEVLTEKEIVKLIESAEHPRDKAFIATLAESGGRIGEIATLNIKNIAFDEYGAKILVDGKTGERPIRLIASTPFLSTWINMHPQRQDPEAPLWINIGNTNHNKEMGYQAYRFLLHRVAKRAGIKKKVNPQSFRHARATELAMNLKEFQMNQYFGWVQGSKMPQIYVHLSGRDMDEPLLEMYGMKKDGEKKVSLLKPKICQVCNHINGVTSTMCDKCAKPLELNTALELESKKTNDMKSVANLLTPEVLEQLIKNTVAERVEEIIKNHPKLSPKIEAIAVRNSRT